MKTDFRAKFLQHMLNKKKKDEGFTLIELLVVIIIVGVLAAIALPSFLNQVGKARGSEARASLGVINRSQQAFRLERGAMATQIGDLDAKITSKFYTYAVASVNPNEATATAAAATLTDIKQYASAVAQNTDDSFTQIICESQDVAGAAANNTADAQATSNPTNVPGTCLAGLEVD